MFKYPHTIMNGAGETIIFHKVVPYEDGDLLEGENFVSPGAGTPMHVHYLQEEGLTVLKGRLGYILDGQEAKFAGAGETVVFKPGEVHRFWNAGKDELHCTSYAKPADNLEYLLSSVFASQKNNGGKRPDIFEMAFLLKRYKSEFGITDIPVVIQTTIFPILIITGRLLGKYRKFADAPGPVKR